jgi:hypothetical protein
LTAPAWTLFQNSWEVPFGMSAMDNARRPLSCRAQPVDIAATPAVMQNAAPRRAGVDDAERHPERKRTASVTLA